jgi:uncharacterized membrane protein YfcA
MIEYLFPTLLLFVACAYAMVGHGGASGYMALGILFALSPQELRPQVLCLNLLVAGFSFIAFFHKGYFKPKLLFPLVIVSMPAAYLGARWQVAPELTHGLLGTALFLAALRMLLPSPTKRETQPSLPPLVFLIPHGTKRVFSNALPCLTSFPRQSVPA